MKPHLRLLEPRGLNREQVAAYIGVGATKFDELVATGAMPKPKVIGARRVYDKFAVDLAFDKLSSAIENDWDVELGL